MIGFLGAALQSRTVCSLLAVAAVLSGLFLWHQFDKSSAVRRALEDYVAGAELVALRARIAEAERLKGVADQAAANLQSEIDRAQAEAVARTRELETYVSTVDETCRVRPDLLDRLQNR